MAATYYDLEGVPVRRKNPNAVPEITNGGPWRPYVDPGRLAHASRTITRDEFESLCESVGADPDGDGELKE